MVTLAALTGIEERAIALNLDTAIAICGLTGEISATTVSGIPDWASLSAGIHNNDGSWTLTAGELAGLTLTPSTRSEDRRAGKESRLRGSPYHYYKKGEVAGRVEALSIRRTTKSYDMRLNLAPISAT